ncbi:MAG: hypothetical protein PHW31_03245 [Candidatus Pacebacteria bacterium]|nr:hypothetical protein [Candidatus Paceibacterota bacterium]
MKIGFLVSRNIYFRIFGFIIDAALQKSHEVFCLHDYSQPQTGSKAYQFPLITQAPAFLSGKAISLSFQGEQDFKNKVLQNKIQVIVSLDFIPAYFGLRKELQEKGIFWTALQNGFDSGPHSGEHLAMPDKFFIYSPEWLKWMFEYLKKSGKTEEADLSAFKQKTDNKVEPVGFWPAEQQKLIDAAKVRNKWAVPNGRKVVLFLPFPFGSSVDRFWTRYIYGASKVLFQLPFGFLSFRARFLKQVLKKENDLNVCKAIRRFCDENNGFLLVKSRAKDPVKPYLAKMADKVLYDESFYPSTIKECFSIADICFNFYSTAAIEAASAGVPNVCIAPDVLDWKDINNVLWESILGAEKDFFGWPKVSYLKTISEILKELPQKTFEDFSLHKEQQVKYLQKFANGNTESASFNIISTIEKLVQSQNSL